MSFNMISEKFYQCISKVIIPSDGGMVPLHAPSFTHEDSSIVSKTVDSTWVSYQGEMVRKFESQLASYLDMPFVETSVNATTAMFITLKALGIGPNDEVLLPSLTFAATANSVLHAGAIPHFIESSLDTFNIDFEKLTEYLGQNSFINEAGQLINKNTGSIIKAFIPVHVLGSSCDMEKLEKIAKDFSLTIIEDSAEALGSEYQGKKVASISGIGIISFNGNKIITTGGGGAVVTRHKDLAMKIRHLSTTAKIPHAYEFDHDEVGYNLRLPALNAALGYSQLLRLDTIIEKKRKLYKRYQNVLAACEFGTIFDPDTFGLSNCWLNAFLLKEEIKDQKNKILEFLNAKGICARPFWKPLHTLAIYQNCPRSDCSVAQNIYDRVICLPSGVDLVNHA